MTNLEWIAVAPEEFVKTVKKLCEMCDYYDCSAQRCTKGVGNCNDGRIKWFSKKHK